MATITVRNVPEPLVERIKFLAEQKGISMEQEVRDLLQERYSHRQQVLERIRQRSQSLPVESAENLPTWKVEGRP
jgi:plasmid stability protein